MNNLVVEYKANEEGCDYIVGDIHGMYEKLMVALKEIGFDEEKDRLFSVGDLIDRGPHSYDCLKLVEKPWFFSVLGNHEDMMLNALINKRMNVVENWYLNGGRWHLDLEDHEIQKCIDIGTKLPMAIGIRTDKGLIGICHAQPPKSNDWSDVAKEESALMMLWGRSRIKETCAEPIKGVYKSYHGHSIFLEPIQIKNSHFIDTGSFLPKGKITIVKVVEQGKCIV